MAHDIGPLPGHPGAALLRHERARGGALGCADRVLVLPGPVDIQAGLGSNHTGSGGKFSSCGPGACFMSEAQVKLNIRKDGSVSIVKFEDRKILDELVINEIGERLNELAESEPQPEILLDFENVEHLSSAALGMLVVLNKQLAGRQGQLVLAGIRPQIYEVFKITRLNRIFNIHNTTEDALKAFH